MNNQCKDCKRIGHHTYHCQEFEKEIVRKLLADNPELRKALTK